MIYLQLFWVFFVSNTIIYGGGPATIPFIQHEVVTNLGWMTYAEFAEMLAMGNSIPGPIASKMSAYIGFSQGGVLGAVVATLAAIMPSMLMMLGLMGLLAKHRNSPKVKRLTLYVRPTVAVLLGTIAFQMFTVLWADTANTQLVLLAAIALVLLERLKLHPALVVVAALIYGATVLVGY